MSDFKGTTIISCGTLRKEIKHLVKQGRINPDAVLFTPPGLHEWPAKLEELLAKQLEKVKEIASKVLVVYGTKCFIDTKDPARDMDALLAEWGPQFKRIQGKHCVDMLASKEELEAAAEGQKIYWITAGWIENWSYIFRFWDAGKANEMFPSYDKAVSLDALGSFESLSMENPEKILEISDWMKIPLEPLPVGLDRLESLLSQGVEA